MFTLSYFTLTVAGTALAYLYGRSTQRFLWREYIAMLAAPLTGVLGLTAFFGLKPIRIFFLGVIILPLLEWGTGRAYHKILGSRLWEYHRYPLPGKYTSWLTLPIWGAGAVLLWLIMNRL